MIVHLLPIWRRVVYGWPATTKCARRLDSQAKTSSRQGCQIDHSTLKPSSLAAVKVNDRNFSVGQGLKLSSPDVFDKQQGRVTHARRTKKCPPTYTPKLADLFRVWRTLPHVSRGVSHLIFLQYPVATVIRLQFQRLRFQTPLPNHSTATPGSLSEGLRLVSGPKCIEKRKMHRKRPPKNTTKLADSSASAERFPASSAACLICLQTPPICSHSSRDDWAAIPSLAAASASSAARSLASSISEACCCASPSRPRTLARVAGGGGMCVHVWGPKESAFSKRHVVRYIFKHLRIKLVREHQYRHASGIDYIVSLAMLRFGCS